MDFRQLQYMTAVADSRNITHAARSLYISQSALSHYIKNVEEELGTPLFDRSTTPISLTTAGERYIESARLILMEKERLDKEIRDITQHMIGKLVIGSSRDRASYMMPRLIPEFTKKYPGIETVIYTDSGQHLLEKLRNGGVDLVLLPASWRHEAEMQGLTSEMIYTEELVLAVKSGTLSDSQILKGTRAVLPSALKELRYFLEFPEHAMRVFCDAFFRRKKIRPMISMEFPSNITCYRMAATGMGATVIPFLTTRMANAGEDVDLFSLGEPPETWDVHVFYRKDAYLGQPEMDFIELAKQVFANEMLDSGKSS